MRMLIFAFFACFLLLPTKWVMACAVFCSADAERTSTAYSMEWPGEIDVNYRESLYPDLMDRYRGGGVFTSPAGLQKQSVLGGNSLRWKSKYKSIVLSVFGPDFGFNGVNEMGLEVYLLGAPKRVRDFRLRTQISEMDSLAVLLDSAANVEEAVAIFEKNQVEHRLFPVHFFIKDRGGKVAIVEFNNGLEVYYPKGRDAILTNDFYPDELAYRKTEKGILSVPRAVAIETFLKKNPLGVERPLAYVGDASLTQWSTQSVRRGTEWSFIIKVNPHVKLLSPKHCLAAGAVL